ncbi:hypothetical protein PoB_002517000 [Plakobranchus ocellatus]|uniref:Uncharacterized protein n=1 Tax=Plakobranchus ocellatus TaxID=259542 RepID=A0AAV3ZVL0_9GAST|nr:hypothetical protein PoB_002517000 [Plakobranchus ocellatus]
MFSKEAVLLPLRAVFLAPTSLCIAGFFCLKVIYWSRPTVPLHCRHQQRSSCRLTQGLRYGRRAPTIIDMSRSSESLSPSTFLTLTSQIASEMYNTFTSLHKAAPAFAAKSLLAPSRGAFTITLGDEICAVSSDMTKSLALKTGLLIIGARLHLSRALTTGVSLLGFTPPHGVHHRSSTSLRKSTWLIT